MNKKVSRASRREFVRGIGAASVAVLVAPAVAGAPRQAVPAWTGAIVHADEGQVIPPTPDGRVVRVKVDSELHPAVRMSMVIEDLPPKSEIKVHLHQHEDEIIYIRMGSGIATLGDREVPVTAGATVYVPQGVWHGLRNDSSQMLGMSAIYAPPGFEQAFKDRLTHPNRTPAETAEHRKKFGIVYRDR